MARCSVTLISFFILFTSLQPDAIVARAQVTASFVFGDSLVDAGNNNYIKTFSKANAPHFGIDFPPNGDHPTGRFTNGLTIPDIIGQKLGVQTFAPPFLAPTTKGSALLHGVNYASGGGGILNETGRIFVGRIGLDVQIGHFEQTTAELRSMLGQEAAMNLVAKAVVSVTIGANDFLNNYLLPVATTKDKHLTQDAFLSELLSRYGLQLMRIYEAGARKFIIVAVPPIGCTPYVRTLNLKASGDCVAKPNNLALSFNNLVKDLVIEMNGKLPDAHFVYADAFGAALDIITNYQDYGFQEARKACCGEGGRDQGLIPCQSFFPVCPDRSKYFFFDPYHPTQAANELLADRFLNGNTFIFPMNIVQLAAL